MTQNTPTDDRLPNRPQIDDAATAADVVRDKLIDAMTPGYQAEFDPEEAERAGAFVEDALSEADALASVVDATVPVERQEG